MDLYSINGKLYLVWPACVCIGNYKHGKLLIDEQLYYIILNEPHAMNIWARAVEAYWNKKICPT